MTSLLENKINNLKVNEFIITNGFELKSVNCVFYDLYEDKDDKMRCKIIRDINGFTIDFAKFFITWENGDDEWCFRDELVTEDELDHGRDLFRRITQ